MSFWIWLKYEIIKFKYRYDRGRSWLNYISPLLYAVGIANYKFFLEHPAYFIPIGIIYIIVVYCIGWYDEIYGIWKQELEYGTNYMNPFMQNLDKKLDRILKNEKR